MKCLNFEEPTEDDQPINESSFQSFFKANLSNYRRRSSDKIGFPIIDPLFTISSMGITFEEYHAL
jgi:hypothetical protein